MKKIKRSKVLLTVFCFAFLFGCAHPRIKINKDYDFTKINRIAVLKFNDYPGMPNSGIFVSDEFIFQLMERKQKLIERSKLEKVLDEQDLGKTGIIQTETAINVGKILGVEAIILGTVDDYKEGCVKDFVYVDKEGNARTLTNYEDAHVSISVRIIDVENGEIIAAGSHDAYDLDTKGAVQNVVYDVVSEFDKKIYDWYYKQFKPQNSKK